MYGWLGVSLVAVNSDYKDALGVGKTDGALVSQLLSALLRKRAE